MTIAGINQPAVNDSMKLALKKAGFKTRQAKRAKWPRLKGWTCREGGVKNLHFVLEARA